MLTFPDRQILAQIYQSANSIVYKSVGKIDGQPVILKILKQGYPTPAELTRYKQEYGITRSLKLEGVVKAYDLQQYQSTLVMLLEDFGGKSLAILLESIDFTLLEFLTIAIDLTKTLGEIHAANVIHKDINPSNLILNLETGQVKIIDFGISTVFTRENTSIKNPNVLEGTLAYMSPEQTGRMNRILDYRTDFYSLGATFYQLLTHRLPFETTDALELVHCHIARLPTPPHQLIPTIPKTVSNLVMKLLAKTAEERYQSAAGLKVDLEECLSQLQLSGTISDFPLASQDICGNFQIPQHLYGRTQEIETLLAAFNRIAAPAENRVGVGESIIDKASVLEHQSRIEMMLVAGYAGIGKSALVQEIYKPITQRRGYFISGKFDQLQRNIPYSAIVQAFRSLVQQLLSESELQLAQWREKLLVALGANGQMMIDVIPEIELIIGAQSVGQQLESTENQNRFNLVFQNFVRVFCQADHPLVIFLDDLQWADLASLKSIELMMSDEQSQYLFLIGAYRDNEVSQTHPLTIVIESLKSAGANINKITLEPLKLEEITQLIADTLAQEAIEVEPLAELIISKTLGNPFFVNEFLKALDRDRLFTFDYRRSCWEWDIDRIKQRGITDNVVDLTIDSLKQLPEFTQQTLQLAACVGNSFDLHTLAIIQEKSLAETFAGLLPAIKQGVILPTSQLEVVGSEAIDSQLLIINYRFQHDRLQQAAYTLIDEGQKQGIHLKIGRLLLQNTPPDQRIDKIFDLVSHLNQAQDLIDRESEKLALVKLNLAAGIKAKDATAYPSACEYLNVGKKLLGDRNSRTNYDLCLALYKQLVEVEYLNGNAERAEELINSTLTWTIAEIDRAELYQLLIIINTTSARYLEAIEAGCKGLALLDIQMPETDLPLAIGTEMIGINDKLKNRTISALIDEPQMIISSKKAAIKILSAMDAATYLANTNLFAFSAAKQMNLCLQYGHLPEALKFYSSYGIIIIHMLEDYQTAYEFGSLALNLSKKFNNYSQECQISVIFGYYLSCWMKPLKSTEIVLRHGYEAGIESGEVQFAGYTLAYILFTDFYRGLQLDQILSKASNFSSFCIKHKNYLGTELLRSIQLTLSNLVGVSEDRLNFSTDEIDESEYLASSHSPHAICIYQIFKAQVLYLYGELAAALECILAAESSLTLIAAQYCISEHNFYYSLILTALYATASEEQQQQYWQQLTKNQQQMQIWVNNCPENFLHKHLLVAAEMARLAGEYQSAMDLYDRSIESAREHEFFQNEAIANELAAKFWLQRGKEEFARIYFKKARQGYQVWGAKHKIQDLDTQYFQSLAQLSAGDPTNSIDTISTLSTKTSNEIDLATVIKASQAISSEIALDKLLEQLMKTVMENAGAQKGFLLLQYQTETDQQSWEIEVEGIADEHDLTIRRLMPGAGINSPQIASLSIAIVNYVARTQSSIVLNDAANEGQFTNDPYILAHHPKSILCTPLLDGGKLNGILYLENNLTTGTFTPARLEVLKLLSSQAAISIQNAQLYVSLRENQLRLTQFLEAMPIGIGVLDANGRPYYVNHKAQELLGRGVVREATSEQIAETYQIYLAGTNLIYPSENLPIVRALNGEEVNTDDLEIHVGDKIIPIESWGMPIFNEQRRVVFAMTAFHNITQRKQAEADRVKFTEELALKNFELERAKDKLESYARTLEQRVTERTQELSQTLDILTSIQAELLFENELLRNIEEASTFDYQVGGSLTMDDPTYVVRLADRQLYKSLKRGEFCYVLNPRQMGKSSLMVRMIKHLQYEGILCAPIDMTRIGSENITPDQWYKGIAFELGRRFNLRSKVNFKVWWQERVDLSPVQRLSEFIESVILVEVGDASSQLVIFIDEIDSVLGLNFSVNDFFALIRSCYNQRSLNPDYQRLTFAIFGVATPSELITNIQITPFNIGHSIHLEGFKEHEARPLLQGLAQKFTNPHTILKEVLAWTSGQPFLTQRLCKLIRNSSSLLPPDDESQWVDSLVRTEIINNWEAQDEPEHLKTIRDRLLKSRQSGCLLTLYQQILEREQVSISNTPAERELLLSGLVVKQAESLQVQNRIYAAIFDRSWLERQSETAAV
jgi:predicted ATPase/GAF domain-containing protein/tRNA A-37 threonylcarbamoyl transferase component Bud32